MAETYKARWTSKVVPDRLELTDSHVRIRRRESLLSTSTDEIRYERIANVRVVTGIRNATVVIETSGSAPLEIRRLPKQDAEAAASAIRDRLT